MDKNSIRQSGFETQTIFPQTLPSCPSSAWARGKVFFSCPSSAWARGKFSSRAQARLGTREGFPPRAQAPLGHEGRFSPRAQALLGHEGRFSSRAQALLGHAPWEALLPVSRVPGSGASRRACPSGAWARGKVAYPSGAWARGKLAYPSGAWARGKGCVPKRSLGTREGFLLVPKLRLGTRLGKLCFPSRPRKLEAELGREGMRRPYFGSNCNRTFCGAASARSNPSRRAAPAYCRPRLPAAGR